LYGLENFTLYPVQGLLDLTPLTFKTFARCGLTERPIGMSAIRVRKCAWHR